VSATLIQPISTSLSENANEQFLEINSKLSQINSKLDAKQNSNSNTTFYIVYLVFYLTLLVTLAILARHLKKVLVNASGKTIGILTITFGVTITFSFTILQIKTLTLYQAGNIYFYPKPKDNIQQVPTDKDDLVIPNIKDKNLFIDKLGEIIEFQEAEVTNKNAKSKLESILTDILLKKLKPKYVMFIGIADKSPLSKAAKVKWGTNQALAQARAINIKDIYLQLISTKKYEVFQNTSFKVIPYGPYNIEYNEPPQSRAKDRRVDIYFAYEL
jgi:flagellar motor protein MotB